MAQPQETSSSTSCRQPDPEASGRFEALPEGVLQCNEARKSDSTYQAYHSPLLRILCILGTNLRVAEIKKLILAKTEGALESDFSFRRQIDSSSAEFTGRTSEVTLHPVIGNPR